MTMRLTKSLCAALLALVSASAASAQNPSLQEINQHLAELDERWNQMVRLKARLQQPDVLLAFDWTDMSFRVVNRAEMTAITQQAVQSGASAKWIVATITLKSRVLRALDVMMKEWQAEADQTRSEMVNARTAPFFIGFTGSLLGQYRLTCKSSDGGIGNFAEGGPARLDFLGAGRLGGAWGEGVIQGTIDKNGVASGTARGPSFTAQWSGALKQEPDGRIGGGGAIGSPPGTITCSGFWSIP